MSEMKLKGRLVFAPRTLSDSVGTMLEDLVAILRGAPGGSAAGSETIRRGVRRSVDAGGGRGSSVMKGGGDVKNVRTGTLKEATEFLGRWWISGSPLPECRDPAWYVQRSVRYRDELDFRAC
jgi:hypothetical protein